MGTRASQELLHMAHGQLPFTLKAKHINPNSSACLPFMVL